MKQKYLPNNRGREMIERYKNTKGSLKLINIYFPRFEAHLFLPRAPFCRQQDECVHAQALKTSFPGWLRIASLMPSVQILTCVSSCSIVLSARLCVSWAARRTRPSPCWPFLSFFPLRGCIIAHTDGGRLPLAYDCYSLNLLTSFLCTYVSYC